MSEINGKRKEGLHTSDAEAHKKIDGKDDSTPSKPLYVRLRGKQFVLLEGEEHKVFRAMLNMEMQRKDTDVAVVLKECDPEMLSVRLRVDLAGERDIDVWFWEPTVNPEQLHATAIGKALDTIFGSDQASSDVTLLLDDPQERKRLAKDFQMARELSARLKKEIMTRWNLKQAHWGIFESLSDYQGAIPENAMIWISDVNDGEVDG